MRLLLLAVCAVAVFAQQIDISQVKGTGVAVSTSYRWTRTNGRGASGDLSSAGAGKTITLTPCPQGVNGTDAYHWVYISGGTGTAESALITGGTCTSGAATGTITATTANTHSGAWVVQSATNGIKEALVAGVDANGRGRVYVPPGQLAMRSQLRLPPASMLSLVVDATLTFGSDDIASNDGVVIDSCESCHIEFSDIAYWGSGRSVFMSPENPSPNDDIKNIQWSEITFRNVQAFNPVTSTTNTGTPPATANFFICPTSGSNPSQGLVSHNKFQLLSSWGAKNGLLVDSCAGAGDIGWFEENLIYATQYVHTTDVGIRTCDGDAGFICPNNIWDITVIYPRQDNVGAQTSLQVGGNTVNNLIRLANAASESGSKNVIISSGASSNRIEGAIGTTDYVDNSSGNNSNEIINTNGTSEAATYTVDAQPWVYQNVSGRRETVTVSGADITKIEISQNGSFPAIDTGLVAGTWVLYAGEALRLTYTGAPPTVTVIRK